MLLSHPRDDELFEHVATHHVDLIDRGRQTLRTGRRALRSSYPDAALLRQAGVLIRDKPTTVWFGYRDGRSSATIPNSRWWSGASVARATLSGSGRMLEANPEFRALVGLPSVPAPGERVCDVIGEALGSELERHRDWIRESDSLLGAVDIRLPSGRARRVEFYARPSVRAPRRFDVSLRSSEDRDLALTRSATTAGLGSISLPERKRLLSHARRRILAPGDVLGVPASGGWSVLVLAGIVRLMIHVDGLEPTLAYAGHGALLGTHLVHDDETVPIDLQAVTPSIVIDLSTQALRELMDVEPGFARAIVDQTQALMGATVTTLAARTGANLSQRLAREIVQLSDAFTASALIPVTEQQLADGVGSIRESVGRTIGTFRRLGLIATTRHGVLILDDLALREHASLETLPSAVIVATPGPFAASARFEADEPRAG
jgi:CRP/FNR family transcriptional regulator, cyclic AMP receptor protein